MSQVRFGFGSGSNSDLEENSYRRVLVIGGVKVGKSSILSEAINGGFVYEYHATTHTDRFYDCTRQLEFIDTPGINDDKLNGLHSLQTNNGSIDQEKTPEILWDQLKLNFKSFREDIEIMELANDSMDRINSVRSAFEIPYDSYDAILLVYTDDDRSKRLAKALRHVFLSKSFKSGFKPIYFLHNTGDIERRPLPNMLHMTDELAAFQTELNDKATGLIYRDDLALHTKFYEAPGLHFLPTVSAETGHQLALVFNQLARELHHIRKRHPIQSTKTVTRNGCNIPNVVGTVCDIQ